MSFDYFLGANTPVGFVSTFPGLTERVARLVIIKGGPGCGKSTAMKRIADAFEAEGGAVERIWCSSDTRSLDGVYLPEIDTLYVDGTAPHTVEPTCPGARDQILNLGDCWDIPRLEAKRREIESVSRAISACYSGAYRYLRALGELSELRRQAAEAQADFEKIARRTARIIQCRIPHRRDPAPGREIRIFLNALTPDGPCFLNRLQGYTVTELYDPEGLYGAVTRPLLSAALAAGHTVYAAFSPLAPHDAPLHLVIPALRYALLTSGGIFGAPHMGGRRIRLDLMKKDGGVSSAVGYQKETQNMRQHLMVLAAGKLREAKALHDELESLYRPAVDFQAVDRLTEAHIETLRALFKHRTHDCR